MPHSNLRLVKPAPAASIAAAEEIPAGEVFPKDEHNAALVANLHPRGRKNPTPAARYNLVVIGAGTAGLVTAAGAAGLGAKVALVERHLLGGDCLNVGCVPSKCIISSARVVGDSAKAQALGVRVPAGVTADFAAVMERMRRLRARISDHDSVHRFQDELGVDVFLGQARFTGPDAVEVEGKRCASSAPSSPPARAPRTHRSRGWPKRVFSPTRRSSRSPNVRADSPSSAAGRSVASCRRRFAASAVTSRSSRWARSSCRAKIPTLRSCSPTSCVAKAST